MTSHGHCKACRRAFRSQAASEYGQRVRALHDALRRETDIDATPSKPDRHRDVSETFRQTAATP